jgi:hypothetical protein
VRVATIIAVALLAAAPAILHGLPPGHDHALHLTWYTHFATQLWDGDPRPRWLFTMNAGFGSPSFFYYGPTPYYITSAFRPLVGAGDPAGWRQLGLSAALALVISGIGAYRWLREAVGAGGRGALGGAIAYTILPYHVAADLYARAAFGELWALAWLPWVLYFAKRGALVGLAVTTALLVTTHLPTTIIFLGVPVLEALFVSAPGRRLVATRRVLAGIALGAVLSAAHWLPALANQHEVQIQIPTTDPRHYARSFLFAGAGASAGGTVSDFTRALEAMTLMTAVVVGGAILTVVVASRRAALPAGHFATRRAALFWGAAAVGSVVMMTPLARPIWELLPMLQPTRFPWRFNSVLAIAAGATCALAAGTLGTATTGAGRIARAAPLVVLLAASAVIDARAARDSAAARRAIDPALATLTVAAGMDNYDLRPRTARFEMFEGATLATLAARSERAHVVSGSGTAGIVGWGPRDIRVRTESPDEMRVVLDQLYYTGWRARLVPGGEPVAVEPDPQWGLAMLRVPAGRREVALAPTAGAADAWGAALSVLAALALAAIAPALRTSRGPSI